MASYVPPLVSYGCIFPRHEHKIINCYGGPGRLSGSEGTPAQVARMYYQRRNILEAHMPIILAMALI